MRCVSSFELMVIEKTLQAYDLSAPEVVAALALAEQRAMDTSAPFKPYLAAHAAASNIVRVRK
jgi:hypothetical protein